MSPKERISIQQLYLDEETPMLLPPKPMHNIHVALDDDFPLAAIMANFEEYERAQIIRLSKPTYRDRHVFRSLVDRVCFQWSRTSCDSVLFSLRQTQRHNQDELKIFQELGFVPYHETLIYTLPLLPFEKSSYRNWYLQLVDYASRNEWLSLRNQFSHLLSEPFTMTGEQYQKSCRLQTLFYTLTWCEHPVGIVKACIHQSQLVIQEIHIDGDDAFLREALSFLQQKFFCSFQELDEMHLAITTLQPDLQFAARQQGASHQHVGYFTMTKQTSPTMQF